MTKYVAIRRKASVAGGWRRLVHEGSRAMVARYAIGLVLGVLLATASGEVPFAMAAGARLGAHATSGVHPGFRPGTGRSSISVSASQYVKTRGQPEWFS